MGTRSIHLLGSDLDRESALNEGTVVASIAGLRMRSGATGSYFLADVPEASFEELYRNHHSDIAAAYLRHAHEPGVLVAAVVPGHGLRGHLWLAADATLRAGIAGRHERTELFLGDDPALSLRHLAILVRREEGAGVRIRVFDLRTGMHIRDEADRRLATVAADGPLFLRASVHRFFLLPTGTTAALPSWDALPPRVFADARDDAPLPAVRPVGPRPPPVVHAFDAATVVTANPPLEAPEWMELVEPGEAPFGHLRVSARGRTTVLTIGAARASRGILIGRYDRCDGVLPAGWMPEDVSRVHAMLLCDGGSLHVIDAGSTNGTSLRGLPVRCEPMPAGERVWIGSASMVWDPAN